MYILAEVEAWTGGLFAGVFDIMDEFDPENKVFIQATLI